MKLVENANTYIEGIFTHRSVIRREEFVTHTDVADFCPVIDTSVAMLITMLLKLKKPVKVLELGASIGYSATIMAQTLALWGGTLTTVEFDPQIAAVARRNFQHYGVADRITLVEGDALQILPQLSDKYDFIFLDLYNDIYPAVLDACLTCLNDGGLLIADDTLDDNASMEQFNRLIANHPKLESVLLPLDDGLTLAIYHDLTSCLPTIVL